MGVRMPLKTPQQQIELFHMLFLKHLGDRIDKQHFVLKGGCNLRFYYKSIRYSEDIDLDVRVVARDTLKSQVSKLLTSRPFQQILKTRELSIIDINPAKQTDTTQRWKLKVQGPATALPLSTKIEFSRREISESFQFVSIDAELLNSYQLYPILSNRYDLKSALLQKINALIHRTETQARDVFDIDHLMGIGAKLDEISSDLKLKIDRAIENALSISYTAYKSQVVSYLKEEYQEYFGSELRWNAMQEKLIFSLEKLKYKK